MTKEPPPPKQLQKVQRWFASIISRPIDIHNKMRSISPSGKLMEIESGDYIAPSPTLTSAQRIEIYNQQFWWRLLNVLHESFPTLVRLFGYRDFNQKIGFPYIQRYLPNHWSLSYLGERLPFWIQRFYQGDDKKLVYTAAHMDNAFTLSFIAPHYPSVTAEVLESVMDRPLYLQPHIYLYNFEYHFLEFRDIVTSHEPDYWIENDFPQLTRHPKAGFMVWRDHQNTVGWIPLEPNEYYLLRLFQKGISFDGLCEWLETQPPSIYHSAANHLQQWTHRWVINEWLRL